MNERPLRDGQIVIFCHSLLSDWNHGNAHFLRGIVSELKARGMDVVVYEPCRNWSLQNLLADRGAAPVEDFYRVYPTLDSVFLRTRPAASGSGPCERPPRPCP